MSNIKDHIKEKLNQLSKEELVDALADVCAIYVSANITTQLSSANCIQQCVNNVMTQVVELKLVNEIVGIAESSSKTFPRVDEFEVGASYRRCT